MPHATPLIATVVAGLSVAFLLGALAQKLRISPIAGYLLAGVAIGPFTPGFVADRDVAAELAEIGVILLMFGVGLHFSLRDLMDVRRIAVPGAIGQIAAATLMGVCVSAWLGWPLLGGIVFGLALSVASTVVLLRALQAHNLVETERGRIAVGWLIVEDLVMVLALVMLPVMADVGRGDAGTAEIAKALGLTALKVGGFAALMLVVGRRLIPAVLHWVVHTGSRELFRLAVLAIALGVAFGAAMAFGVSFALGAFFAGMILGETPLSRRATEETLPLRDAFAVLFFVSVGMLFNPGVIVDQPLPLLVTVAIIVLGKSAAAWAIVRAFGRSSRTALTIAGSLAQIGEFSFILATLGGDLDLLPQAARDLILAGAILSIFANPFLFSLMAGSREEDEAVPRLADQPPGGHTILIGYGRVGRAVAEAFAADRDLLTVIDEDEDAVRRAGEDGLDAIRANALEGDVFDRAGILSARTLLIAVPEGYEGGAIFEKARALNPTLYVVARAHSDAEVAHLQGLGLADVVLGEREIAHRMLAMAQAQE
jgi:CPA2 family monovalent cation:H+ antiporter-2